MKTYVTTGGFFELVVAAPSKKAALDAWRASPDLFQRGFAKETSDPAIIKATMAMPGKVLQRGVGAHGAFKKHADLPDVSAWKKPLRRPAADKSTAPLKEAGRKKARVEAEGADSAANQGAAQLDEAAKSKREREAARAAATDRKARERREHANEKAERALRAAQGMHDQHVAAIDGQRLLLDRRAHDEAKRWQSGKEKLEAAVRATKP